MGGLCFRFSEFNNVYTVFSKYILSDIASRCHSLSRLLFFGSSLEIFWSKPGRSGPAHKYIYTLYCPLYITELKLFIDVLFVIYTLYTAPRFCIICISVTIASFVLHFYNLTYYIISHPLDVFDIFMDVRLMERKKHKLQTYWKRFFFNYYLFIIIDRFIVKYISLRSIFVTVF